MHCEPPARCSCSRSWLHVESWAPAPAALVPVWQEVPQLCAEWWVRHCVPCVGITIVCCVPHSSPSDNASRDSERLARHDWQGVEPYLGSFSLMLGPHLLASAPWLTRDSGSISRLGGNVSALKDITELWWLGFLAVTIEALSLWAGPQGVLLLCFCLKPGALEMCACISLFIYFHGCRDLVQSGGEAQGSFLS